MKKVFTLVLLLCSLDLSSQTIYYVKLTGNDANSGTSWATAFKTLQKALTTISSGQIWVAAGTYYPDEGPGQTDNNRSAWFRMKNNVGIYGGFAGTETQLSQRNWKINETILSGDIDQQPLCCGNSYHVVLSSSENNTAILDGFTITEGSAGDDGGGGMQNANSTVVIRNCYFFRNYAYYMGGGMRNLQGANPSIYNCIFSENKTGQRFGSYQGGAGIYNDHSSPRITNCSFLKDTTSRDGGAIYNFVSNPTIENSIFWGNQAATGGAIMNTGSSPNIVNCSFSHNSALGGGAIKNDQGAERYSYSYPKITNCILWGNIPNEVESVSLNNPSIGYSIIQGNYWGSYNLDPLFVNAPGGDLHLMSGSPAIDGGTLSVLATGEDLDGAQRIVNSHVDMGAYEFQPGGAGTTIHVKTTGSDANDGTSWEKAFKTLQKALAVANYHTIWVAAGTYYPDEIGATNSNDRTASFRLKNNVAIYGGFEGTETALDQRNPQVNVTILSGDIDGGTLSGNAYHVVTAQNLDYTAELSGFTITGGNANGSETPDNQGGGIYISSCNTSIPAPRIYYCTFSGNDATYGGAVYIAASFPNMAWCTFSDNSATMGGAIYNGFSSQTNLLNASFTSNTANNGGAIYIAQGTTLHLTNGLFFQNAATGLTAGTYKGGAVFNSASYIDLINCSFSANTASAGYGGAIYNENSSPNITNSILWGNSSEVDKGANGTPVISYSIVQGGYSEGSNIIDADPLFTNEATGDMHLQPGSPAIDAGTDEGSYFTDFDGHPRKQGLHIDMGAYEFGSPGGPNRVLTLTCPGDTILTVDAATCGATLDFLDTRPALVSGGAPPVTLTYAPAAGTVLPIGKNTVTVTATDSDGSTKTCSFTVTVVDSNPPEITGVSVTPAVLYPPNHKMREVKVNYTVKDECGTVTTTLSVVSNEPGNGAGDGNTSPDWQIINNHLVTLRAERSGSGLERVYTITITAMDASGNKAIKTVTVRVPHDNKAITLSPFSVENIKVASTGKLMVKATPNPTASYFTLTTSSPSDQLLDIIITDAMGRKVEERRGIPINSSIQVGQSYRAGVYQAIVTQGPTRIIIKMIKQSN